MSENLIITHDSFCSFWKAVSKSLVLCLTLRTHALLIFLSISFWLDSDALLEKFSFVTCFIPFAWWIAQWIMREMTNTISLVSKEFCLQWIGIDVSLSRCVRLLCDIYILMSLVLFLFSYQTCFSVSHAAITRYVLQDLWTTTMYHVYYDQINAMVVTTICCFCLCDDRKRKWK